MKSMVVLRDVCMIGSISIVFLCEVLILTQAGICFLPVLFEPQLAENSIFNFLLTMSKRIIFWLTLARLLLSYLAVYLCVKDIILIKNYDQSIEM